MGFDVVTSIVERFMNKLENPIKIYGHDQTRSFCFIDDAVRGTVGQKWKVATTHQITFIMSDKEITMEELTKFIGNILGYEDDYRHITYLEGSVSRRCPRIVKAVKNFGYNPAVNWKDAVVKTVDWWFF